MLACYYRATLFCMMEKYFKKETVATIVVLPSCQFVRPKRHFPSLACKIHPLLAFMAASLYFDITRQ